MRRWVSFPKNHKLTPRCVEWEDSSLPYTRSSDGFWWTPLWFLGHSVDKPLRRNVAAEGWPRGFDGKEGMVVLGWKVAAGKPFYWPKFEVHLLFWDLWISRTAERLWIMARVWMMIMFVIGYLDTREYPSFWGFVSVDGTVGSSQNVCMIINISAFLRGRLTVLCMMGSPMK